jgi:hypothetical protein
MPLLRLNTGERPLLSLPSTADSAAAEVFLCQGPLLYYHYGVDGVDDRVRRRTAQAPQREREKRRLLFTSHTCVSFTYCAI